MKLIMPIAGQGNRFYHAGYTEPKPFILINGKPMFQHAVENIGINFDEKIFIVQKKHNIADRVRSIYPDSHVVELDGLTDGAAVTVLEAKEYYDDGSSIFIANCDQHVDWDHRLMHSIHDTADASIAVFSCVSKDPKWSYAQIDGNSVIRVAEKQPISEWASVGFYSWRDGREFIRAASEMIKMNNTVNGEFYICPVLNYSIKDNKKVIAYPVKSMNGIGTPEDLEAWQKLSK